MLDRHCLWVFVWLEKAAPSDAGQLARDIISKLSSTSLVHVFWWSSAVIGWTMMKRLCCRLWWWWWWWCPWREKCSTSFFLFLQTINSSLFVPYWLKEELLAAVVVVVGALISLMASGWESDGRQWMCVSVCKDNSNVVAAVDDAVGDAEVQEQVSSLLSECL